METRLPRKFIVALSFLALIIVNQAGIRFASAGFLPVPEAKETWSARLASDATHLLVYYSYLDPQSDPWHPDYKYGKIKEWNGGQWQELFSDRFNGYFTVDNFDIAVQGNNIVTAWQGNDSSIHKLTCFNGKWSGGIIYPPLTGVPQDPRVAFAFGIPYLSYNSGNPRRCYVNPTAGTGATANGVFRYFGTFIPDMVATSTLTGDANAFYLAFTTVTGPTGYSGTGGMGSINVLRITNDPYSYTWLGDPIAGEHPHAPEIVLWGATNTPVMAWVEDPYIYIAKWEPGPPENWQKWQLTCSGTIGRLRMGVFGDTLYVAFQLDQGSPATSVTLCKWENFSTWSSQIVPLASSNPANISFQSLAVYKGDPVVAFIDQGVLKIAQSSGGNFGLNTAPIINLLLGD